MKNCLISSTLSLLWCLEGCSKVKVANKAALYPPTPSYWVGDDGTLHLCNCTETHKANEDIPLEEAGKHERLTSSKDGGKGPHLFIFNNPDATKCLLYFHGNATDVGELIPFFRAIATSLRVTVVAVEYRGYGLTQMTSSPSIDSLASDACTAFDHLLFAKGTAREDIFLYGQSLGSYPACYVAAHRSGVGGCILHSPLLSALNIFSDGPGGGPCLPKSCVPCLDVLQNDALVRRIMCPVFVIHGMDVRTIIECTSTACLCSCALVTVMSEGAQDDEVPVWHGKSLAHLVPEGKLLGVWLVPNAGHNDIVTNDRFSYYIDALRKFMSQCCLSS